MSESGETQKPRQLSDRYVRWRKTTRDQLGFTNNLILGFTLASLGFALAHAGRTNFAAHPCSRLALFIGVFLSLLSGSMGLWCSLNRLWDFRLTAQIVKNDDDGKTESAASQIEKEEAGRLGRRTWTLLYWQL